MYNLPGRTGSTWRRAYKLFAFRCKVTDALYLELSPKHWRTTRGNLLTPDLESPLCAFTVPPAALNFARSAAATVGPTAIKMGCVHRLRPVVGRKTHYGSKSRRGTEVAAILYTLVETAKLHHVDPTKYLSEAV